ncbi:MAG: hypothetical protein AB1742_00810 [bacterium]
MTRAGLRCGAVAVSTDKITFYYREQKTGYLVGQKRMMNNEQGISNDEVFFPSTFHGSLFDIRYLIPVQKVRFYQILVSSVVAMLRCHCERSEAISSFLLAFFEIASVAFGSLAMTVKTCCTPVLNFLRQNHI